MPILLLGFPNFARIDIILNESQHLLFYFGSHYVQSIYLSLRKLYFHCTAARFLSYTTINQTGAGDSDRRKGIATYFLGRAK